MALSRYAPYVVTNNAMMVEYFIRGLRPELQDTVIPLMCALVEEAAQRVVILERTVQASNHWVLARARHLREECLHRALENGETRQRRYLEAEEVASSKDFSKGEVISRRRRNPSKAQQGSPQNLDVLLIQEEAIMVEGHHSSSGSSLQLSEVEVLLTREEEDEDGLGGWTVRNSSPNKPLSGPLRTRHNQTSRFLHERDHLPRRDLAPLLRERHCMRSTWRMQGRRGLNASA
ncbi:hypothetical protein Taro_038497, partial [Colocasia esculenta]|nr:hypothetical protein [Colocasia esculenta]